MGPRESLRVPRVPGAPIRLLILCLLLTAAGTAAFARAAEQRDRERFHGAVMLARARIASRLDTYVSVLLATRGLFLLGHEVTADEFRRFAAQIDLRRRYPGIQGIGFSRRLAAGERAGVEREMRAQGHEAFRIWPDGPRPELHTIALLEPLDRRNRAALGYDMSTEPERRAAMSRARDTGQPAASGRVTLVQEIDEAKQAGFLIYVPVYGGGDVPATLEERRRDLVGFVYAPFRMDDLLAGILGGEPEPTLAFAVYDEPDEAMHRSPGFDPAASRLADTASLDVAGRLFELRFQPGPGFLAASRGALVPYLLGAGGLASGGVFLLSRARRRAQEATRLQARVLESMSEGVSVSDESGVILYTNAAEDRMFGYGPGELLGRHVSVLNTYPDAENRRIVEGVIAALRARGSWSGEFSNVRRDGTTFVTSAHITALEITGRRHWVCVQEDITERKRAENERHELLLREQAARAEAEAASRAKDEFLAMLGHELRNPLAPIATAVHLLRLRQPAGSARELEMIERQLEHVVRLVDDLLDVSRITRGKIELRRERLQLGSVVSKAVEIASPLLEQRRHRLELDLADDLPVDGDPVRLAQVVANLLTNAARFTPPGGHVSVSARREGDGLVLRVRDDGAGIEPDLLPHVFDLFAQGPQPGHRAHGGLGIGLTLVRSLVEAHGGTVEARSDGSGTGSEFAVRLPAAPADDGAAADAAVPPRPLAPRTRRARRVLVVDDNADAAEALAYLLRAVGHEVAVALDGPQALELASAFRPEVAVLDLGLPVMDGYELAARLRAGARPRLLAVTGYGQDLDRARTRAAGFARHLVKPVEPAELLAAIEELEPDAGVPGAPAPDPDQRA